MSNFAVMPINDYVTACNTAREKTGTNENILSKDLSSKINATYEAGKKAEYDAFWDSYQISKKDGSIGTNGQYAYWNWKPECFKPKYDLRPSGNCDYMFGCLFGSSALNVPRYDLAQWLEDLGITLDLSQGTTFSYLFTFASVTRVPVIDVSNAGSSNLWNVFKSCYYLETIDKFILPSTGMNSFTTCFADCLSLKNIVIEGVIGKDINFQHSPLTKASITSIIEHLSDTATEKTVIFKKSAKESAFTDEEWSELISSKPNWTISVV